MSQKCLCLLVRRREKSQSHANTRDPEHLEGRGQNGGGVHRQQQDCPEPLPGAAVSSTDSKLPAFPSHTSFLPEIPAVGCACDPYRTFSEIYVIRYRWTKAPHSSRTQTFVRTPQGFTLLFLHRVTVPFGAVSVYHPSALCTHAEDLTGFNEEILFKY